MKKMHASLLILAWARVSYAEEDVYTSRATAEMMKARSLYYLMSNCQPDKKEEKSKNPFCPIVQEFAHQCSLLLANEELRSHEMGLALLDKFEQQLNSLKDMMRNMGIKVKLTPYEDQKERDLINSLHDFNRRMEKSEYNQEETKDLFEELVKKFDESTKS